MGELKVEGRNEAAEKLKTKWELKPGEPYDLAYLEKFLTQNGVLLPEGFDDDRDVLWLRDCSDNTVSVTIELIQSGSGNRSRRKAMRGGKG